MLIPETREQLVRIASACARHKVPVTVRGGGTQLWAGGSGAGGGVVLDMTRFDRVVHAAPGVGRFRSRRASPGD